ncbi:hypothetical protein FSP39_001712 [Pinctada imbricata]|uniref:Torsin-1A C-terminal domain-containing protein n=1 Tax=Pinctada imbricata TaxID=66713 RepID=A0AA88YC58_PINIB|nr:hypothetical protein FSP39_001712 [Pinctada imbricata]
MNAKECVNYFVFFSLVCGSFAIEPVTGFATLGVAVASGLMALYRPIGCLFGECCSDRWIGLNATALRKELSDKLYGQHLVNSAVTGHVKGHMLSRSPTRAMALSFHGGTGTGKNYVSKIIAENIYRKGMKSQYVHLIAATKEFPHEDMVPLYKDKLRNLIEKSIRTCERSLFIFDEVDKMPAGIIDTIKPYIDYYEQLNGVDYRKSMFIFLSNTGSTEIFDTTLKYWQDSRSREDIRLLDMENMVTKAALNTKTSGLYHSDVLIKHLVTAYIPFLPLERRHVRDCIKDYLVAKRYYKRRSSVPDSVVREVADELTYFPRGIEVFSSTGCKRVPEKVDYVMMNRDEF